MPIYEYRCDACNTVFEEWHQHADDITELACPECGKAAHRLISNTTFVLKGGGWYVTEYGNRKADTATSSTSAVSGGAAAAKSDKPDKPGKTEATPAAPPAPAASKPAAAAAAD